MPGWAVTLLTGCRRLENIPVLEGKTKSQCRKPLVQKNVSSLCIQVSMQVTCPMEKSVLADIIPAALIQ